jgi:FemAB-related protein (PEP-CTERM system-associated)
VTSPSKNEASPSQRRLTVDEAPHPPPEWDEFVHRTEGASFCHLGGWGEVFRRSLRLDPLFLTARAGEEIRGVLPLIRMPRLGAGSVVVSIPYLNYGGPLGNPDAQAVLLERTVELAGGSGARRLEIRSRNAPAFDPPSAVSAGREKVTVVLDLPPDPETLLQDRFRSKLRAQIRRPMKEGMAARFGEDQVGPFYRVFAENMRDLGTPVLPRRFFEEMAGAFPDHIDFGVVYHQGQPVAGGCGFRFQGEFEMTWASSLRAHNRLAPNMFLYWSLMERCIERGDRVFNFGRCTAGGGTHRFKSQWGGVDEPLHWLQWPEGSATEDPQAGIFALATRVWQLLPLGLANRLGPVLARRIPTF